MTEHVLFSGMQRGGSDEENQPTLRCFGRNVPDPQAQKVGNLTGCWLNSSGS
jgi:hypothetical protein